MTIKSINQTAILEAVAFLQAGELVALPTETVYGLGADARQPQALTRIFLAKERPFSHPLIVHLASTKQLSEWARELPPEVDILAKTFWPGPLTLILKKRPEVSELLTGGQDTVGLRLPAHPVAQALLQAFGGGIAAPSANRFTHLSPTTAQAVREELGSKVACILEGGICEVGLESTILDLSREQPVILRPGMISAVQLEQVLKKPVRYSQEGAPRVPGREPVHYAPETRLSLVASAEMDDFLNSLTEADLPLAFLVRRQPKTQLEGVQWLLMNTEPQQYAHDLYLTLRRLDQQGFKRIAVEAVPKKPEWEAIQDRLTKAAGRTSPSLPIVEERIVIAPASD